MVILQSRSQEEVLAECTSAQTLDEERLGKALEDLVKTVADVRDSPEFDDLKASRPAQQQSLRNTFDLVLTDASVPLSIMRRFLPWMSRRRRNLRLHPRWWTSWVLALKAALPTICGARLCQPGVASLGRVPQ